MGKKVYSGLDGIPRGTAADKITEGCIVLEGGAFRGVYSSGVLDRLMLADINMRCTIGVSAGALCGMNYVSGQIGRSAEVNLNFRHDSRYVGFRALLQNRGVIGFKFLFKNYPKDKTPFDEKMFTDPERRFVAVATNCLTGKAEYYERSNCSDIYKAVQASSSMPYISAKVMVDGIPCLDGGCSDKIPYLWPMNEGYEKIIIVRTRDKTWRKELKDKESMAPYRFYRGKYREFAKSLASSYRRTNEAIDEIERLENEGKVFVIAPSTPVTVTRLEKDMEKLGALYWQGYNDVEALLPSLEEYLRTD
ncbi:MAG: patatin family protein [Clostridia bacterium]|nr:patatin family protein [Clostridia bacterium]